MSCHKDQYPGIRYQNYDESQGLDQSSEKNVLIPDVALAFSRVSTKGNYLEIGNGGCFSRVAYSGANSGGSKANTHFQGIIRHHNGNELLLSGGDSVHSAAQMFFVSMVKKLDRVNSDTSQLSTYEKGVINRDPLGYNSILFNDFPDNEKVVKMLKINDITSNQHEQGYWHAGGISRLRDIYVVPLESKTDSKIRFYFLDSSNSFYHLASAEIPRVGDKAGAVTICRFKSDRYLIAVWQDGNRNGTQNIDFYLSRTTSILDGFLDPVRWYYRDCLSSDDIDITYQNIQFVLQDNGDLFLIGMENKSNAAPKVKGENVAELLAITFDQNMVDDQVTHPFIPSIRMVNKKIFPYSFLFNFDAGSSVYIDKNKEITLYATFHYLRKKVLRIMEFPPSLEPERENIDSIHFSRIELYEEENFGGRMLRVYGDIQSKVKKTADLYIEGKKYKKGFRSLKFQFPLNSSFTIYSRSSFSNKYDIPGDGKYHKIHKVENIQGFGREIKSFRFTIIDGQAI
jgi:hypothetical protein